MAAKKDATPAPQEGESAQQVEGMKQLYGPEPTPRREGVPEVLRAIQHVQERFSGEGLAKTRNNAQQGYAFRGIDDVYNSLATFLCEAKLVITPRCLSRESEERKTKNGGLLIYSHVMVEYDFYSSVDGSKITIGPMAGEAMDSADKSTNKAMSAAYKYLCLQTFCIPTEGDNDADATTHQPVAKDDTDQPPVGSQPKQSSAPTRQAQPQRQQPTKETVDFHVKAIMGAETLDVLKKAFGLAWKQYENTNDPKVTTPAQSKFKQKYEERKAALEGAPADDNGGDGVPAQEMGDASDEPPVNDFDSAFADEEAQQ